MVELEKQGIFNGSKVVLSSLWQNINKELRFGDKFSCSNGLGEDKDD